MLRILRRFYAPQRPSTPPRPTPQERPPCPAHKGSAVVRAWVVFGITGALFPEALAAPAAPVPYPPGLTTPWRTPGVDLEQRRRVRSALDMAHKAVAGAWLQNPKTLTEAIGTQRILPITTKREADKILTGALSSPFGTAPLLVEPTWCQIMDRQILFVTVADAKTNQLLAGAHTTIPRGQWDSLSQENGLASLLTSLTPRLTREALTLAARRDDPAQAQDALHVGLSLAQESSRIDEGSSHCLTMLLEEKLSSPSGLNLTVARLDGLDHLALIRNALAQDPPMLKRPTRSLVLDWHLPFQNKTPQRAFPVTYSMTMRPLEAVFGKSIPDGRATDDIKLTLPGDGRVKLEGDSKLALFLENEKKSLQGDAWPQVARVNRAWVYLDRGRAWGLQINDRMVTGSGDDAVRGHVVRYFGPEEGLSSPRGFPIREGAILYIRKNQKTPQRGMEFRMDPRTFPTPWPPAATAAKP